MTCPSSTSDRGGHPQSLAKGAAGVALLHLERTATGLSDADTAHTWLAAAADSDISAGPQATLFFGAPALAFAVHAAADRPGRYERALESLDARVAALTRSRLDQAHARIDRGDRPALAEFDLINGLTGLGAHLLRHDPNGTLIGEVLAYLVRLTEPLGTEDLPGWWTHLAPTGRRSADLSGGHGNFGMAHGISGPLALLSLAMRRGIAADGQAEAITRICSWLDTWRQDHDTGPWWPETITLDDTRCGRPTQTRPLRPSWCYGTPGLARAQQLAGQATADTDRQRLAEQALFGCLNDPEQLKRITDHSLCHGSAGLFQTAWHIAADAHTPGLTIHLAELAERLLTPEPADTAIGLLQGSAGLALALSTAAADEPAASRWDTCLLLT
ncbi:MAG: lanthionine synthetase C family protein [Pseudonocardiales bacterium]